MSDKNLILQKNDEIRRTFTGGKILLTRSVADSANLRLILNAVKEFSNFNSDNDPYNEHDFGLFEVSNRKYFWKFDYFDEDFKFFKENGNRVLTIGAAEEY